MSPSCETDLGSGLSAFVPALTNNRGFMVVGFNELGEGSYGDHSGGQERESAEPQNMCP